MEKLRYYYERFLLYLLFILGITLILTVFNAIFHYPEPYRFWKEPLSRLGGITSTSATPNHQSSAIFATGLQICSFICLFLGFGYVYWEKVITPVKRPTFQFIPNYIFAVLSFIMGAGALLLAVPYDHPRRAFLHALGTLMFVIGFGIFNIIGQLHRRSRKSDKNLLSASNITTFEILLIGLLFIMLIIYIIAFLLDRLNNYEKEILNYFNASSQKVVIIICLLAIFNLDPDDVLLPDTFRGKRRKNLKQQKLLDES